MSTQTETNKPTENATINNDIENQIKKETDRAHSIVGPPPIFEVSEIIQHLVGMYHLKYNT